jgi:homoaconitase/3-isopropylmalate dehydratase large subunit
MTIFPPQTTPCITGTVLAVRLIEADYIRRRCHVFHDVPFDHCHSHRHDRLPSTHMVTHDDARPHNHTVASGAYEPTVVVDIHQEKPDQSIDRQESIHLQRVFITSCAASRLLNNYSRRATMNQTSPTYSITHHQGGFHV